MKGIGYLDNNFVMIIVIAFLILMSAYFSATETAFSSLSRIRMKNSANDTSKEDYDANTVSGFVIQELGKIPKEGDHFIYENLSITVTKTDSPRVLEIHVEVLPCEEE